MVFGCRRLSAAVGRLTFAALTLIATGCLPVLPLATRAQDSSIALAESPTTGAVTCIVQDEHGRSLSQIPLVLRSETTSNERIRSVTAANGSLTFEGLRAGAYELMVAGAILLQPRHIQIVAGTPASITLHLPITVPNAPGSGNSTVSVQQLSVPENVRETLYRAYDAWMHNDLRQSRALAARTLEMRPYYGPAMSLLGILELQEGHPTEAITGLLQALQYNPNSVRSYIGLASAYNQLRQNANALDALAIASNLAPDNWQIHYETGRAYLGMGRFEQAIAEFDRSANVSVPDAVVLHVGKAHALLGLKDYAAARTELETVLKTAPKGPYAAESRNLVQLLDAQLRKTPVSSGHRVSPAADPHLEH